jgi:hypothetical protein
VYFAARRAPTGMVKSQAHYQLSVTPQTLFVTPTPIIEPVIVCVVETGIIKCSVKNKVKAPADSATTPSKAFTLVILEPIDCTIFRLILVFTAFIIPTKEE